LDLFYYTLHLLLVRCYVIIIIYFSYSLRLFVYFSLALKVEICQCFLTIDLNCLFWISLHTVCLYYVCNYIFFALPRKLPFNSSRQTNTFAFLILFRFFPIFSSRFDIVFLRIIAPLKLFHMLIWQGKCFLENHGLQMSYFSR